MLPDRLVNTGDTVKTICDKRASTLNALSALPVGKFILAPAYEPSVDLQGFFVSLQHGERSRITPDRKRTIRFNLKRLYLVVQSPAILALFIVCKRQPRQEPVIVGFARKRCV